MLNHVQKTACALTVLATFSLPAFAEGIDVRVVGTITPTACTPMLSGGGTIDYGSINPTSLKSDAFTVLDEKRLDFAITCDAPAKVAITATSQRGASAVEADGTLSTVASHNIFGLSNVATYGLGLDDSTGIGGYGIRLVASTITADSNVVDSIQSDGNTTSWGKTTLGSLLNTPAQRYSSWATAGTTVPVAFTTLTGKLGVQAYLNKASALDLSKPIALDGLTTLELVYL